MKPETVCVCVYCDRCKLTQRMEFVRRWTDPSGHTWDHYVCSVCGEPRQFMVFPKEAAR